MTESPSRPPEGGLLKRVLRETSSFAFWQTVGSLLTFLTYLLLARLLERRDLGIYGLCSFYLGIGALLGDAGMGAALLRCRDEPTPEQLRSTFTVTLWLGTVLMLGLMVAAPWLGAVNHLTPAEVSMLRGMAPLYLVGALRMLPNLRLQRSLSFGRIARIELAASLLRHALALGIAFAGGHAWALVAANVVQGVVQLALAWRAAPGWVGLGVHWPVLRPLLSDGIKLQALGICAFFKDNISRALLGHTVGPEAIGLFDFGQNYIQVPVVAINALARVQLSVYSRLGPRDPALFDVARGTLRVAFLLGVPLLLVQAWGGPWLLAVLYNPRWLEAMPVVWGLWGNMAAGLLASPLFTFFQGQGYAGRAVLVFLGWTLGTWAAVLAVTALGAGSLGAVACCYSALTVVVVLGMIVWAGRVMRRSLVAQLLVPVLAMAAGLLVPAALLRAGFALHPLARAGLSLAAFLLVLGVFQGKRVVGEVRALFHSRGGAATDAAAPAAPATDAAAGTGTNSSHP